MLTTPKNDTRTLVPLAEAVDTNRFGRKAAHLGALLRAGFDVPDGFVVPVDAEPSVEDVASVLHAMGDVTLAVRSSSVAEDLPDASFAGQYLSLLGVRGVDRTMEAITRVRESAAWGRVLSYGGDRTGAMAVLVQRLVKGEASGVAFSANPVTGRRDEVRVTAARGLGEALVSGETPGDEWSVEADHARRVRDTQRAIDADTAVRVAELARRVEARLGRPADIEWTFDGGRLKLLQARPITVLPTPPKIVVPKGTWQKDTSHFTEPITPFGASTYVAYTALAMDRMIAAWGLL